MKKGYVYIYILSSKFIDSSQCQFQHYLKILICFKVSVFGKKKSQITIDTASILPCVFMFCKCITCNVSHTQCNIYGRLLIIQFSFCQEREINNTDLQPVKMHFFQSLIFYLLCVRFGLLGLFVYSVVSFNFFICEFMQKLCTQLYI